MAHKHPVSIQDLLLATRSKYITSQDTALFIGLFFFYKCLPMTIYDITCIPVIFILSDLSDMFINQVFTLKLSDTIKSILKSLSLLIVYISGL